MASRICSILKLNKAKSILVSNGVHSIQRISSLKSDRLEHSEKLWSEIAHFYYKYGDVMYEDVSQTEHALQSATLAMEESGDGELAIGAFLHDIGHLIEFERKGMDHFDSDREHEQIGFDYLRYEMGVDNEKILNSILYHVAAKRYLCFAESTYYDHLSASSKHTLSLQGGIFNAEEAAEFEKIPFFKAAAQIRKWDDNAKMLDAQGVLDMKQMKELFVHTMSQ